MLTEEFIDAEDVMDNVETSSTDNYSDISSSEWYSSCYNSDKDFNVMFIVLFGASGSYIQDNQKIKEIERILTLLISRRFEMSSFHVSTTLPIKNPYFERYNMPTEDVYSGTIQWTSVQNPVFVKIAFNYNIKNVYPLMDIILRFTSYCDKNRDLNMQLQIHQRKQESHYGWKVITGNGMLLSMTTADNIAELLITPNSDKDYLRSLSTDITMFFNTLLPGVNMTRDNVMVWKHSRSKNTLNEDFLDS